MRNITINLTLSAAMHFLVDGVCACCLFQLADIFEDAPAGMAILTYNVMAFMTQPMTGWLADRRGAQRDRLLLAAVGFLTIAVGLAVLVTVGTEECRAGGNMLPKWLVMVGFTTVAVVIGLGNSLFHVWGGKQTAEDTRNDMRALGVFVATGGMGLVVGILFHEWWLLGLMLTLLCAAAVAQLRRNAALVAFASDAYHDSPSPHDTLPTSSESHGGDVRQESGANHAPWGLSHATVVLAVAAIMAVVLMRSYYGETFTHGFDKDVTLSLAIASVATLGKASGGWIARRLGIAVMAVALAVGITACAVWREGNVGAMLAGIYLINTTMPVTLWMANRLMPGREGLAFGLLAAVLVPGYLLATL